MPRSRTRPSTGSRRESRTKSRESTASCTTSPTSPPRQSSGNEPRPARKLFQRDPLRSSVLIYVVDNGGQWTHREWRGLPGLGGGEEKIPKDKPASQLPGGGGPV